MKLSNCSRLTGYYIFIITCILPLFFLPFGKTDAFGEPKYKLWLVSLIAVSVFIMIGRKSAERRLEPEINSNIYVLLGINILIWLVSTAFSVDIYASIAGPVLYSGLLQLFMGTLTFILVVNYFQYKGNYLKYVLISYCAISIYCLAQFYQSDPFARYYGGNVKNFVGQTFATIGNQNQVATCLSVIFVVAAFTFILDESGSKVKIFYILAAFIIFAGDIATNTRGGWLAVAFAFAVALPITLKKSIYLKRYLSVCAGCGLIFFMMDITSGGIIFERIISVFYEGRSVAAGNFNGDLGSKRMEIWLNSIDLVKKYWLIGSGPNTFAIVYNTGEILQADPAGRSIFLSPHNESLRLLITTGIVSLMTYWAIVIYIMKKGIEKIKDDMMIVPFILGLFCYLVKGMFNCSAVTDMIIFWILLAVIYRYKQPELNQDKKAISCEESISRLYY